MWITLSILSRSRIAIRFVSIISGSRSRWLVLLSPEPLQIKTTFLTLLREQRHVCTHALKPSFAFPASLPCDLMRFGGLARHIGLQSHIVRGLTDDEQCEMDLPCVKSGQYNRPTPRSAPNRSRDITISSVNYLVAELEPTLIRNVFVFIGEIESPTGTTVPQVVTQHAELSLAASNPSNDDLAIHIFR